MQTTFHKFARAAALLALFGSATLQAHAQTLYQPDRGSPSRETVRADFSAWKESGLADAWRGESTPNMESTEYRAMYQRYLQLSGKQVGSSGSATGAARVR